jgi:ribosomal protein S18 acetylase RimI-like enzyme
MKYEIREADLNDFEKMKPIHKEVHDQHVKGRPDKYNPTNNTLDFNYFKTLVEDKDSKAYIIEYDKKIIAYTFLRKYQTADRETIVKNVYVFMDDLGVTDGFRGKGIGKLLFNKALEFTKEVRATSLELGVWEFNEQAIKFYEGMGMNAQARKMEIKL